MMQEPEMSTVLIIDDSETVRNHVRRALEAAKVFDRCLLAEDGVEGFKLLLSGNISLVLCDFMMPGIDGFKFLSLKNSKPELREVPVIMLTGEKELKAKVRCLEAGASDYLTKPFHDEELVARVRVHLKIKTLQDELRVKNQRLEDLSRTDSLTKLANRRYFMELLHLEFLRAERYGNELSYVMIDLDLFKTLNDEHGHLAGDSALRHVAQLLKNALRRHDVAGRYGGEEFALLLPETGPKGALVVAERCRHRIAEAVIQIPGKSIKLTASMGVSSIPDPRIQDVDDLIRIADEALYQAKDHGRNQVVMGESEK